MRYLSNNSSQPPFSFKEKPLGRFISGVLASGISIGLLTSSAVFAQDDSQLEPQAPQIEEDVEGAAAEIEQEAEDVTAEIEEEVETVSTDIEEIKEEIESDAEVLATEVEADDAQVSEVDEESETSDDEEDSLLEEEVLVTGIRASQRGAIDLKKQAGTMVDAIVAEDVSKFPDKNITESLQRVTGVQISRDFGEGSTINIRGMESGLNRIEFDGVSALGDGSRTVALTDTASELIKSLTVVKGSEARITEGGIGGTVQIEMRKPNDFDDHFFSASLENIYNDLSKKNSPRGNLTGVYKFTDDMGVMMNFNWMDRKTMIHALRNTSWDSWADYDGSPEKTIEIAEFSDVSAYEGCQDRFGANAPQVDDNGNPLLDDNGNQIKGNSAQLQSCQSQWWDFGPTLPRYGNWGREETRISTNIGFGWDVTDKFTFFTDYTLNKRDKSATDYNLQLDTDSVERIDRDSVIVDDNHNIRAFTTRNASYTNRTLKFNWDQEKHLFKMGGNYEGDKIEVSSIVSYSESNQDIDSRDINVGALGIQGVRVVLDEEGAPEFDLTSAYRFQDPDSDEATPFEVVDVNSPSSYNGQIQYKYAPVVQKQKENSAKIDFVYHLDEGKFFTKAQTGYRYAMRSMDGKTFDSRITYDVRNDDFTQEQMNELLTGATENVPRFFPSFDLGVSTLATYEAVDPDVLIPRVEALADSPIRRTDLPPNRGAYDIEETSHAGYVQFDFEQALGDMYLRGNLGVRVVETDLVSNGDIRIVSVYDISNERDEDGNPKELLYDWDGVLNSQLNLNADRGYTRDEVTNGGIFNPTVEKETFNARGGLENSYTDVLPSINLSLDVIPEELTLFAGWAKVMARPDIESLNLNTNCTRRANLEAQELNSRSKCTSGNPFLDPFRATQFDLALNWYANEDSLVSVAYFEKKLTSYVEEDITVVDLDFFAGTQNGGVLYNVETAVNVTGITTRGIEVQGKTIFTMLPGIFSNMGLDANYTYMDADDVPYRNQLDGSALPLLGQSKNSYNLAAFYEDDYLTIRLAYNYRDEFLSDITDENRGNPIFVDSAGFLDGKISYDIGETGFTIFADARNLLAEVKLQSAGEGRFTNLEWSGREYAIGLSYKM